MKAGTPRKAMTKPWKRADHGAEREARGQREIQVTG